MIWQDGVLPEARPALSLSRLSYDLLSYGYALLGLGLRLREMGGEASQARIAFEQAATALGAVMAKGNRDETERDFHFVMAAASYHLAHLSARAYSLLAIIEGDDNFSPIERVLALLMRRDMNALQTTVFEYKVSGVGSDEQITASIQAHLREFESVADQPLAARNPFSFDNLVRGAYRRVLCVHGSVPIGGRTWRPPVAQSELSTVFRRSLNICGEMNLVPYWWVASCRNPSLVRPVVEHPPRDSADMVPVGGDAVEWARMRELFIASLLRRSKSGSRFVAIAGRCCDACR